MQFRAQGALRIAPTGFEYPPFLTAQAFDRSITIDVDVIDQAPPRGEVLFDTGDGWLLIGGGEQRCLRMPLRNASGEYGDSDIWRVHWQQPLQRAHAYVNEDLIRHGVVQHLVQYPLDQIILTSLLADEGGLLIHACGGLTPAGGLAFAGVSGAGKSTLTRLLMGVAGLQFFSDDRLFLRHKNNQYQLYGTPWAGDAHAALNQSTKLNALCFLSQSQSTQLRPLEPREALERLLPVTTLPWFDKGNIGHSLQACANLLEQVPCYELAFRPDTQAVQDVLAELADG